MNLERFGDTGSVCPVCLKTLQARRIKEGDNYYLQKSCPQHGEFRTILWRGEPDILSWYQRKIPEHPGQTQTASEKDCPHDCGLCPAHRQKSCCVLIEVTRRCNLACPVCYANAGDNRAEDPSIEEIGNQLRFLYAASGNCNIQLSGGEPTVRDDLPEIVQTANSLGYSYTQLNTNGIRLAADAAYVKDLKAAGLSAVFLQFDGTRDDIYKKIRGHSLLDLKLRAVKNCTDNRLGVVLVPTLVPGVNMDNIGGIIDFAVRRLPEVRAVHFQPISYFGRYPGGIPTDEARITLPEVLKEIEKQTGGRMKTDNFAPGGCENSLCSFHGDFIAESDGLIIPFTNRQTGCCADAKAHNKASAAFQQAFMRKRWAIEEKTTKCCDSSGSGSESDSMDRLLEGLQNKRLGISCMVFQDADNLDLERLKDCYIHVAGGGNIYPFCAYNLTDREGNSLYRSGGNRA